MGLEAVVYKNPKSLGLELLTGGFRVDERTGEVYLEETFEGPRPTTFKAIDKWLGNIESIGHLREEVTRALGDTTSILQTKFLYSGTHCGDVVGLQLFGELLMEIALLRERTEGLRSLYLPKFLDDVTDLIQVARTENNPIVFV